MERARNTINHDEWVQSALLQSVHLNSERAEVPTLPKLRQLPSVSHPVFDVNTIGIQIIRPRRESTNKTEEVFSVLMNSNIRRGNSERIARHVPALKEQVGTMIRNDAPIDIVLCTLPFKDQNPLTTRHSLENVDLGEYLHFAQLRNICNSIEEVYSPGAHITLLTDGLVYADFFANGQRDRVEQYRKNCEGIRDELGLGGKVAIRDMETLVQNEPMFTDVRGQIESSLRGQEEASPEVANAIRSLERGMLINTPAPEYNYDEYASLLAQPYEELPQALLEKAHETAIVYASFLLTMKQLNVVQRDYADALRATVHPKDAPQLPVHLVNKSSATFPYNGVPVVSERKLAKTNDLIRSTRIMRFYQVLEEPNAREVYVPQFDEPFYYMTD